jgi:hypothetical protein
MMNSRHEPPADRTHKDGEGPNLWWWVLGIVAVVVVVIALVTYGQG